MRKKTISGSRCDISVTPTRIIPQSDSSKESASSEAKCFHKETGPELYHRHMKTEKTNLRDYTGRSVQTTGFIHPDSDPGSTEPKAKRVCKETGLKRERFRSYSKTGKTYSRNKIFISERFMHQPGSSSDSDSSGTDKTVQKKNKTTYECNIS
uniref:Uncharacterized protein n=1 Tax=Clastoptera arizonana TaxID=38151 RepID=A0A1B6CQZ5_9HEMI